MRSSEEIEFAKAQDFGRAYESLHHEIAVDEIRGIAQTFTNNIDRIQTVLCLPANIAYWSTAILAAGFQARRELNLDLWGTLSAEDEERVATNIANQLQVQTLKLAEDETNRSGQQAFASQLFDQLIDKWANPNNSLAKPAVEAARATLGSAVTALWTAFEVLIEDLWVTAINLSPSLLDAYTKPEGKNQEKSFAVSEILKMTKEFGGEILKHMGTILRDSEKVEFDPLRAAKKVYEKTFDQRMKVHFAWPDVFTLELIRNVIVHKGGLIDARFVTQRDAVEKEYGSLPRPEWDAILNLKERDTLPLTGPLVKILADAVIQRGVALTKSVDRILQAVPK
jgi:hypothetical protein